MKEIWIEIPIIPKAQKRARSRAFKTPDGRMIAQTYKDKGQRTEEDNFRALLYERRPEAPFEGEVSMRVIVTLPIPKSKPKKFRTDAEANLIRPTTRPDVDNLIKFVFDCMNGIFFHDDKQIVSLEAHKIYGVKPGWTIYLRG